MMGGAVLRERECLFAPIMWLDFIVLMIHGAESSRVTFAFPTASAIRRQSPIERM